MASTTKTATMPRHLGAAGRRFWKAVTAAFEIEAHEYSTLQLCAEALDRADEARAAVDRDGAFVEGRYGPKVHPGVAVERDARASFARLYAVLKLPDVDGQPARGVGRPGRRF